MDYSNSPLDPSLVRGIDIEVLRQAGYDDHSINAHAVGDLCNDTSWLAREVRAGRIDPAQEEIWHAKLVERHRETWGAFAV